MKKIVKGFFMSLSMFSILPAPQIWDENSFKWVIPMFPGIGLIIGAFWFGAFKLTALLSLPIMLWAAVIFLVPLFLSGFIHIDGYMDTSDALASRAETEKKRLILKDPHAGAFAVMALGIYMLLGFSAVYTILEKNQNMIALVFIPILSRCLSGFSLLWFHPMFESGFGAAFRKNRQPLHMAVLIIGALLCLAVGPLAGGSATLVSLLVLWLCAVLSALFTVKQFKGISGDLCGFIITTSELGALISLALAI